MNLFANCIMALDAGTGKMKWYYQTIHHDLWDRDIPCPPNLATIRHDGRKVDVVVQTTKDGLVYVLDRDSGTSIFPVTERPVPTNGLPGEHPWPTQKFPSKPLPLSKQVFTEDDITDLSPTAHDFVKRRFLETSSAAGNNKFIPPGEKGTIALGYSGGAEWGGNAIDTDGIFYQNANDDPWDLQMIDMVTLNKEIASLSKGHGLYVLNCSGCHGMDRAGDGHQFPSLQHISARRSADQVQSILKTGSGRMPSFAGLFDNDRDAIVRFLMNTETSAGRAAASEHGDEARALPTKAAQSNFPYIPRYVSRVWKQFTDSDGYPGIKPPWGTLNAINLNTGDYVWTVPYGEYPELTKKGIPITGARSYGGPLVTAGGLIFIAGTSDEKIRAFDKKTGKQVWEYQLPAGGFATPITYEVDGVQYIAIAAAGARGGKAGGNYVAFRLR
jgi:quinoprotein glucose dehydrogenase